jgi:hypothetical protein
MAIFRQQSWIATGIFGNSYRHLLVLADALAVSAQLVPGSGASNLIALKAAT